MVHLPPLIVDLALILGAGGIFSLIFKKINQPVVLGYILAGFLVGPHISIIPTVTDTNSIQVWAEIGVIFLLFSLGLEFSFKKLAKVGGASSIAAIVEAITMLVLGYFTGKFLGWSTMDSIFLGGLLSVSSTTIIIRAFDELGVKTQKFATLVFGILIVEDLVAILLLVLLSTIAVTQQFAGEEMLMSILKLAFFLILWFISGIFIMPTFLNRVRKILNEELILIISIAFCLLMVVFSTHVGLSAALGAFVMGSILAETSYGHKIEHLLRPVKDLFAAIFFVSVGMLIDPSVLVEYSFPILIITVVTVIGKAISTSSGALISGQTLKHSIQTGLSVSQIGEFSFIIASLGLTLGVTESFLYPITVAVSAITTLTTPYLIKVSEPVSRFVERTLPQRWINNLNKYSNTTQVINTVSDWQVLVKANIYNVMIHSVIIIAVIILSTNYLFPAINTFINIENSGYITLAISFILIAPFIWALAIRRVKEEAYYHLWENTKFSRGPLIGINVVRAAIGIAFCVVMINQYISDWIAIVIISAVVGAVILYFSHVLQLFYNKIEKRFLYNLTDLERSDMAKNNVPKIVPWDGHLTKLKVSPKSPFLGKTLAELAIREKYGINIALIERQGFTIPIPGRDERVYPGDKMFVIGTDEQLDAIKPLVEVAQSIEEGVIANNNFPDLQKIVIEENSPLVARSIRASGIKETTHSLIVGIERNGVRILNPDSSMMFEPGDIVWVVGSPNALSSFLKVK